jgi:CheY-like chemotaxis protein
LLLEHLGFEAELADNGPSAREFLIAAQADIQFILLDSLMPGMDGLQTLEDLRRIAPATPVVVMSGNLAPAAADDFARLGVRVYLQKPFGLKELAAALAAAAQRDPEPR